MPASSPRPGRGRGSKPLIREPAQHSDSSCEAKMEMVKGVLQLHLRDRRKPVKISYQFSLQQADELLKNKTASQFLASVQAEKERFDERSAAETIISFSHGLDKNEAQPMGVRKKTEETQELSMETVKKMLEQKLLQEDMSIPIKSSSSSKAKRKNGNINKSDPMTRRCISQPEFDSLTPPLQPQFNAWTPAVAPKRSEPSLESMPLKKRPYIASSPPPIESSPSKVARSVPGKIAVVSPQPMTAGKEMVKSIRLFPQTFLFSGQGPVFSQDNNSLLIVSSIPPFNTASPQVLAKIPSQEVKLVEAQQTALACSQIASVGLDLSASPQHHYCNKCNRGFKSRSDMEKHYRFKPHTDTVESICDASKDTECNENAPGSIQAYWQSDKVACEICKKLLDQSQFVAHMSVHALKCSEEDADAEATNGRQFKCDECNVAYRSKGILERHKRSKLHQQAGENHGLASPLKDKATAVLPLSSQ